MIFFWHQKRINFSSSWVKFFSTGKYICLVWWNIRTTVRGQAGRTKPELKPKKAKEAGRVKSCSKSKKKILYPNCDVQSLKKFFGQIGLFGFVFGLSITLCKFALKVLPASWSERWIERFHFVSIFDRK